MDRNDALRLAMATVRVQVENWDDHEWVTWSDERACFVDYEGDPVAAYALPRRGWKRYEP